MKHSAFFAAFMLLATNVSAQRLQSLDSDWKFRRGPVINAEAPEYDDSKWKSLMVPHDFSMDPVCETHDYRHAAESWNDVQVGPFSRLSIGDWDTGQTVGGEGWYRKTFEIPATGNVTLDTYLSQFNTNIRFDGVYNQAEVWVNGRKAAINVYGYMPFVINLNDILKDKAYRNPDNDKKVNIVVKVLNEGLNSRWYAGSGIFRHVWLETTDKLHLDAWDTYVDGSELINKGKDANVKIFAKVFNEDALQSKGELCAEVYDAEGNVVGEISKEFVAPGKNNANGEKNEALVAMELTVATPIMWSVDKPYMYKAKVYVKKSGEERDAVMVPFGIRTLSFSATEGFKLNGHSLKLRGGCVHHDNGLLGGAGIDRAEVRKVQLMKAQGYNAVRCSHNLPTEAFLTACDTLGLLVIDEVFDQWEESKRPNDYSNYFSEPRMQIVDGKYVETDVTNFEYDAALMVRRDRNHPSVIMWSIGNEIAQRADMPRGKEIALAINLAINNQDGSRPTTMAVNSFWDRPQFNWEKDSPRAFNNVELSGYNYEWRRYEADHDSFPDRIMYGSESFPNEMAANWNQVNKHPYIIGDFVWTAIDYVGEAGLGHTFERSDDKWIQLLSWPWFSAWCGDLDIIGVKKPQSYYRDVIWGVKPLAMAVRPSVPDGEHENVSAWGWTAEENHWNWKEHAKTGNKRNEYLPVDIRPENYRTTSVVGNLRHNVRTHRDDSLRVNVYSREQRVRLLINDSIMGEKDVNPETYTASFTVAYEPGQLKAEVVPMETKAKKQKDKTPQLPDSLVFNTSLAPAGIVCTAVDSVITSSHNDLAYIYVSIVDEEGNLCPTAEVPITIKTTGVKHIAIAGTGHPYDMKSFRSLTPVTFRGKALIIIQPQEEKGMVTVNVTSPGLKEEQYVLELK